MSLLARNNYSKLSTTIIAYLLKIIFCITICGFVRIIHKNSFLLCGFQNKFKNNL